MEKLYDGCFASVPGAAAAFAEALEEESECGALARGCLHEPALGCQHIGKGHAYYLRDTGLLELLKRDDKRVFVVREESFEADVAALWEWMCLPASRVPLLARAHTEQRSPRSSDKELTAAGEAALRAHLAHEYHVKRVVEALADNRPASPPPSWSTQTPQTGRSLECVRACASPTTATPEPPTVAMQVLQPPAAVLPPSAPLLPPPPDSSRLSIVVMVGVAGALLGAFVSTTAARRAANRGHALRRAQWRVSAAGKSGYDLRINEAASAAFPLGDETPQMQ